jgi:hypothetical protein
MIKRDASEKVNVIHTKMCGFWIFLDEVSVFCTATKIICKSTDRGFSKSELFINNQVL